MRSVLFLFCAAALAALGCQASVNAKVGGGAHAEENFDENAASRDDSRSQLAAAPEPEETMTGALLGARHDLRLSPDKKSAVCSCLAAYVGRPNDPAFKWESAPPQTDPDNQLVVALSSDGVPCDTQTKESLGASYWGYRQHGDDIVITVEEARFGRPVTNGAIIPKPAAAGHVYVRPAGKKVPYGRPLNTADKRCMIK